MSSSLFTVRAIALIRSIPLGKVTTYGTIASMAGNRRAARQVARLLHSTSRKERLPWHRVVNREGKISLAPQQGYENQKQLLENEGVTFDASDRINLAMYLWHTD